MKLVLHNYWRSSSSHRVRIGLHLKQLPYEYVAVNLLKGAQLAETYRAKNPLAQVPLLEITEDDGTKHALTQSLAILEYLEDRFPQIPILPPFPYLRAKVRMLAEIVSSGIQPHQNLGTMKKLEALGVDPLPYVKGFLIEGLTAFSRAAVATAGRFCVGDQPTIADCCLVPQLASARRFGVDLTVADFAPLLAIEERCLALEAFAKAAPDQQPDATRPS